MKQIFPEKEYWGLSPNFHIHVSVSELYIPTMGLPFLLEEICGPILVIYKSLTDTWMWKIGAAGRAIPRKGIYKRNCRCSARNTWQETTNSQPRTHNNQQQRHPIINSYHSTTDSSNQLPSAGTTPDNNNQHPTTLTASSQQVTASKSTKIYEKTKQLMGSKKILHCICTMYNCTMYSCTMYMLVHAWSVTTLKLTKGHCVSLIDISLRIWTRKEKPNCSFWWPTMCFDSD